MYPLVGGGRAQVAEEAFSSLRTVRSFAREGAATRQYAAAVDETAAWGLKSAAALGLFNTFAFTVATGARRSWRGRPQMVLTPALCCL